MGVGAMSPPGFITRLEIPAGFLHILKSWACRSLVFLKKGGFWSPAW